MKLFTGQTVIALLLLLAADSGLGGSAFEDPQRIKAAAEQHAHHKLPNADRIRAIGVDSRLRLHRCGEPLVSHSSNARPNGGMTVEVSCPGPRPWKLFIPVRAITTIEVVVAAKGLGANHTLTAADIQLQNQDTGTLPYGFFTRPEEVVGARLRRSVASGTVLVPAALAVRKLVRRGQRVTLVRHAGGIMVKGSGVALGDGVKSQRIQVKTPSSRIVEGIVESADLVRIGS